MSKSKPGNALFIEVIEHVSEVNTGDLLTALDYKVDHACVVLEWEDDPAEVAEFFMIEWEQLMDTLKEAATNG
jgi:hypothetical protein